uniref:Uncharacterized protein n=1 Tax=Vombatus ursinus TaxID=29139 RepID=A0A4X2MC66_VOMUR
MVSCKEGMGSGSTSSTSTICVASSKGESNLGDVAMKQVKIDRLTIKEFPEQNLGKLFMAQAFQEYNN